jgi:hypothetical protein
VQLTGKSVRTCTLKLKEKLRGRSPQANYTDRATAACRRSQCQLLRVEGVAWSAQRIPTAVNLGFLARTRTLRYLNSTEVRLQYKRKKLSPCA